MMKMHEKVKDNRAAAENEAKFAHPRILIIAPRTDKDGKKNWGTALKVNNFKFNSLCFCKPLECKC